MGYSNYSVWDPERDCCPQIQRKQEEDLALAEGIECLLQRASEQKKVVLSEFYLDLVSKVLLFLIEQPITRAILDADDAQLIHKATGESVDLKLIRNSFYVPAEVVDTFKQAVVQVRASEAEDAGEGAKRPVKHKPSILPGFAFT